MGSTQEISDHVESSFISKILITQLFKLNLQKLTKNFYLNFIFDDARTSVYEKFLK